MNQKKYPKSVHILGIGGTLMGAFAVMLKKEGVEVTGTDTEIYPPMSDVLAAANIQIFKGYQGENVSQMKSRPELVVVGNVISRDNPEARYVIDHDYAYTSLPEFMENWWLQNRRSIVVAGTHGKTTTSSLLTVTLKNCGYDPSYFVGGVCPDLDTSFLVRPATESERDFFVLEGDEYDTAFWDKVPKFFHYRPTDVILTSIEFDHADIYPDMKAVQLAFNGMVDKLQPGGRVIACIDYPAVREWIQYVRSMRSDVQVISYGLDAEHRPDYLVERIQPSVEGSSHTISGPDGEVSMTLNLGGRFNALNATAVWIEATALGQESQKVLKAIQKFAGVKRRQEIRAETNGITVIDDFAHHPTAVRETLLLLKHRYPSQRIIAVFEPRSATSRRKVFQERYVDALDTADLAFVSAPFNQDKIDPEDRFSSEHLVQTLNSRQPHQARLFNSVDEGLQIVTAEVKSGDVVVVLSNGGFEGFIPKLIESIQ